MRHNQMKTRFSFATILFLLLLETGAQILVRGHDSDAIRGQGWGIFTGPALPMRGYYSDAIRRRGIEFYASLTHDTNGQPVFEAVRVNPDNSQEVFPGVITSRHSRRISGIIPGRGKFRLKLSRDGTRATGSLHLRRVAPGDVAVSGRLRMEGQHWNPETVTLTYGLVMEMAIGEIQAIELWRPEFLQPEPRQELAPAERQISP
jgi:hypothetical protein